MARHVAQLRQQGIRSAHRLDGQTHGWLVLIDVASFMVLYMLLPHGAATWREILPGAIGAGFLWELAKKAFLFFVSTYISMSNLVYGSVAAIIAFLAWAYLSSLIFLFGAYLSVFHYRLKQQQRQAAGTNTT
jgi:YihY family inner membrane protein